MEDDLKIKKQIEGSNQSPKRCLHAENQVLELKNKKVMSKGVDRCVTGHPLLKLNYCRIHVNKYLVQAAAGCQGNAVKHVFVSSEKNMDTQCSHCFAYIHTMRPLRARRSGCIGRPSHAAYP